MTSLGKITSSRMSATKLCFSSSSIRNYLRSRRKRERRKVFSLMQRMRPKHQESLCWLITHTPSRQVLPRRPSDLTNLILDRASCTTITGSTVFFVLISARSFYERSSLHCGIWRHTGSAIRRVRQTPPDRLFTGE